MAAQEPNKALAWLKAAEGSFGLLPEHPSTILQRTLLLRHLAECYLQLGDVEISIEVLTFNYLSRGHQANFLFSHTNDK